MKRYDALKIFAEYRSNEFVIGNVSPIARELHAASPSARNLYFVQMGYPATFGMGLAMALPQQKFVVFEGDGSLLCGLGGLTTLAIHAPKNLVIVTFDNESYLGGGGLPSNSAARKLDFVEIAKGSGIPNGRYAHDLESFRKEIKTALTTDGLQFIWSRVELPDPKDDAQLPVAGYIPWDLTENSIMFRRELEAAGLTVPWHEAINPAFRLPVEELSPSATRR